MKELIAVIGTLCLGVIGVGGSTQKASHDAIADLGSAWQHSLGNIATGCVVAVQNGMATAAADYDVALVSAGIHDRPLIQPALYSQRVTLAEVRVSW